MKCFKKFVLVLIFFATISVVLFAKYLPNDLNVVCYLSQKKKSGETDDWLQMVELLITSFTAIVSTLLAVFAYRISKDQKKQEDFSFDNNFDISFEHRPVGIKGIIPYEDSVRYLEYSEKLMEHSTKSICDIFVFKFRLSERVNSQVVYELKKIAIFDKKIDWCTVKDLMKEKSCVYSDVAVDFYCSDCHIMEVIVCNTNDSLEISKQHLITISNPEFFDFENKTWYSIYLEFNLNSRNTKSFLRNKRIRCGIELRKKGTVFWVENSRLF